MLWLFANCVQLIGGGAGGWSRSAWSTASLSQETLLKSGECDLLVAARLGGGVSKHCASLFLLYDRIDSSSHTTDLGVLSCKTLFSLSLHLRYTERSCFLRSFLDGIICARIV